MPKDTIEVNQLMTKVNQLKEIINSVKVIGFDLDDTLWNNLPVMQAAISAQFSYLEAQLPHIPRAELEAVYATKTKQLVNSEPLRYQDMSLLRRQGLDQLCNYFGLDQLCAEAAFNEFFNARQRVTLYLAAEPLLNLLNQHFRLVAISNGNASLSSTSIESCFEFHWRAGVNGLAKPDKDMLVKACEYFSIDTGQLLYVGDHIQYDYLAAKNAGAHSVIISKQLSKSLSAKSLSAKSLSSKKLPANKSPANSQLDTSPILEFSDLNSFYQVVKMCITE